MVSDLTRPIIGIENRTAQEVFDIMSDRIRTAISASSAITAGEQEPVAWPCSLGVGDGDGKLFVHGDYDSIKAAQAIIFRAGEATAQLDALRKRVAELKAELSDWKNGHANSVRAHAAALSRAETAETALAEARKALEPFATVLDEYDPTEEDDETPGTFVAGSVTNYDLTLGDFRAARRALTGGKNG